MLAHDQLDELSESLSAAGTLAEAEKLVLGWLEKRYGRASVALEKILGVRPPRVTHLNQVTAQMVAQGLYARECSVIMNEFFILESEQRELGEDDVALLETVTGYLRLALPRILQAEGRDTLTALLGPTRFNEELERLLGSKRLLCLLLMDLDKFGEFNATLGPAEGDKMLVEIAQLLAEKTRPADSVFRLEGDEFAVLLPATTIEDASRIAQRVRESFELRFGGNSLPVTASIGVASWPDRTSDKDELLKAAKDAMYTSWRIGGNRVCVCPPREAPSSLGEDGGGAQVPVNEGPDGPPLWAGAAKQLEKPNQA